MAGTIRGATLKNTLRYRRPDGRSADIPTGPCLIEALNGGLAIIIWGEDGESSAVMATKGIDQALAKGDLVLLD